MDGELQRISALPQKDKVKLHQAQLCGGYARARSEPHHLKTSASTDHSLVLVLVLVLYQSQAYLALLEQTLASSSALSEDLARWLAVVVGSDFPQIVARQVLEGYVAKLPEIEDRETRKAVLEKSIELLQPRVTSFEEEVRSRFHVAI